jgi:hypothetical protein
VTNNGLGRLGESFLDCVQFNSKGIDAVERVSSISHCLTLQCLIQMKNLEQKQLLMDQKGAANYKNFAIVYERMLIGFSL